MTARPRHWIKLWVAWLTTPAHLELSEGAFGLGPLLLLLCTWDGEYESGGWLLTEDGKPISAGALARATHRSSIARLNSQLSELERCGTLKRREDGALGFPKFGHWQEMGAARRERLKNSEVRKTTHKVYFATDGDLVKIGCSSNPWARINSLRDAKPTIRLLAYIDGGFDDERALHERFAAYRVEREWFRLEGELRDYVVALPVATRRELQQDDRRQTNSSLRSEPPCIPPRGGDKNAPLDPAHDLGVARARKPRLPRADVDDALVRHVCDEMRRACLDLTGSPTAGPELGPNDAPCSATNRDHIAKCQAAHNATPEQWTRVIRAQLANVRGNGKHQFMTLSTICAPQNFQRLLDMPSTSGGDRPLPWAPSRWDTTTKEPS